MGLLAFEPVLGRGWIVVGTCRLMECMCAGEPGIVFVGVGVGHIGLWEAEGSVVRFVEGVLVSELGRLVCMFVEGRFGSASVGLCRMDIWVEVGCAQVVGDIVESVVGIAGSTVGCTVL